MKEGSNRVESKLEDLSSRVRRLEAKEEQAQARQGRILSQPDSTKFLTLLQRGNPSEVNPNNNAFVGVVHVLQDYKATEIELDDEDEDENMVDPQEVEGTTELPKEEEPNDATIKVAMIVDKDDAKAAMDRGGAGYDEKVAMVKVEKKACKVEKCKNVPGPR